MKKTVLPLGSSAVVIATAYKNGELHFATRRITISKQMNIVLDPLPIKKEELKEALLKNI